MAITSPFDQYKVLVTLEGREALRDSLHRYRERYGKDWLAKWKEMNPEFSMVIELCANHPFAIAFEKLRDHVGEKIKDEGGASWLELAADIYLKGAKKDLEELHTTIKAEIDAPRF